MNRIASRGAVVRSALATATCADPRWLALLARDAAADGTFVFAVRTTGVYCHPSCASRRARPENVEFFAGGAQARLAGYRPCKRCRADRPRGGDDAVRVARLCRAIERAGTVPTLRTLARLFGASTTQTRRVFARVVGTTPQQYAHAVRRRRVGQGLQKDGTVTQAIFGAGFNSSGRFYEQSEALLGMTPTQFKAGAAGQRIRYAVGASSLGAVLVATTGRGVCAVLLGDDPRELTHDLARRFPRAELVEAGRASAALVQDVVRAVERPGSSAALPLDIQGTAFQQRVWRALSKVPAGSRTTYAELARQIGQPTAARAVAQACAANPVAVVIPCHRVVRADGGLSGYRWGVERKRTLLEREAVATDGEGRATGRGRRSSPRRAGRRCP